MTATKTIPQLAAECVKTKGLRQGVAERRECRRCRAVILAGIDPDLNARAAVLDPLPVTPAGELAALLAGGESFDLLRGEDISYRAGWSIAWRPANTSPVLVTHICGAAADVNWALAAKLYPIMPTYGPDGIPF